MKALVLTAAGFEDTELLCPLYRLREAGLQVDVAAPEWGAVRGLHGYSVTANLTLDDVPPAGHELLVVPGGTAPAALRTLPRALDLVRAQAAAGRPLAAICHGPQLLAAAGLLAGRRVTGHPKISRELIAAGARYEDAPVVVDGVFITSRRPPDLPAFMAAIGKALSAW
ncbi:type 1 glutamine amidotransferase [Dissulfurirhabdus thermomarina]|uniref:Type 1 glutamine amidotransferase n=1 Tax=Dissulfurirhabdus thermomarina TaxID=1765737 RepID=A0A6N9TPQ5_DISTH|nr:type 1 glutamine amidotransferase domain-containing protein [Dissulfurirhabdus thermomarina]NDY43149.1 type 1 glutamine amidotransferase [Dissulfurirhabdus thermomarina]NMX22906.1 type 1 glutamine amidotransferase [Dissulfurirhabdus thermomarina]